MDLAKIIELTHTATQIEPWIEFSLKDMEAFVGFRKYIHDLTNVQQLDQSRTPILFRGHADSTWSLRPRICLLRP